MVITHTHSSSVVIRFCELSNENNEIKLQMIKQTKVLLYINYIYNFNYYYIYNYSDHMPSTSTLKNENAVIQEEMLRIT